MIQPVLTSPPPDELPFSHKPVFRKDIEGLRAVAVTLVVAYHAGLPGFWGGYIGVDIFFVLSGYLITNLLVAEARDTGAVSLAGFYARRVRRLLPASMLMLAITAALSVLIYSPAEQREVAKTTLFTASYLSNFFFADAATNYFGDADDNPLLHTWSLSVEEQFYFVWPLLLMAALGVFPRRKAPPAQFAVVMAVVTGLSFGLSLYLTLNKQPWAFFLMPPRAWEFGVGALAAVLPLRRAALRPAPALLVTAFGWLCVLGPAVFYNKWTLFPGYAAVVPVAGTVILLRAGARGRNVLTWVLESRPFQAIGRRSYSWYLWHWPVLLLAGAATSYLPAKYRLAAVAGSLGLAALSYKFVEQPIRVHAGLAQKPRLALLGAVVVSLLSVGAAAGWQRAASEWAQAPDQIRYTQAREDKPSRVYPDCNSTLPEAELKACAFGPAEAAQTAVLFGDSHAAQWFTAFADTFARRGWRYVVMLKGACPPIEHSFYNKKLGRTYRECDAWRAAALAEIARLKPAVVVAVGAAHYDLAPAELERGTRRMLAALSASARQVVLLRDTPSPGYDVPACLARRRWRPGALPALECPEVFEASAQAAAVFAIQQRAAEPLANVALIDMNDLFCAQAGCRAYDEQRVYYHDRDHLADAFVASLSPAFAARLDAVLTKSGAARGAAL